MISTPIDLLKQRLKEIKEVRKIAEDNNCDDAVELIRYQWMYQSSIDCLEKLKDN